MAERRTGGLSRQPDFTTAEDRLLGAAIPQPVPAPHVTVGAQGAPGALGAEEPGQGGAARRRPLKVKASLADQLWDAVLFMRGHGQPELTQNELLDDFVQQGLDRLRAELNDKQPFPNSPRRRAAHGGQ